MTPAEFSLAVEAYSENERFAMRQRAVMARWIIAPHVKRVPSVNQLVGTRGRNLLGAPNAAVKAHCNRRLEEAKRRRA